MPSAMEMDYLIGLSPMVPRADAVEKKTSQFGPVD
jgi:hypothetical protein